jgi:L-fucose mutarotase
MRNKEMSTMLKGSCIHPGIMGALSMCGHGDKILIADGNYPLSSKTGTAEKVWLGVTAGLPAVTDVLGVLMKDIPIEKAEVMQPENGCTPEIFKDFQSMLGGMDLEPLSRQEFYDACMQPCVRLAVSTGEKRVYANVLLTVGIA